MNGVAGNLVDLGDFCAAIKIQFSRKSYPIFPTNGKVSQISTIQTFPKQDKSITKFEIRCIWIFLSMLFPLNLWNLAFKNSTAMILDFDIKSVEGDAEFYCYFLYNV
jgi:hypothetical protein